MNLFDFVTQNQKAIEQLMVGDNGEIEIAIDQYDFSHPDVTVGEDDDDIVFELAIGQFTLKTRVDAGLLPVVVQHLRKIRTPGLRRELIETIETKYRSDAEAERDVALEELNEAQQRLNASQKAYDVIVDSLMDLKSAWNIP